MISTDSYYSSDFSGKFYYDEGSVSCLKYRTPAMAGKTRKIVRMAAGDDAGHLTGVGKKYWRTRMGKKTCAVHRIILSLFRIEVPYGWQVDHINGNSKDNRIDNLRVVPPKVNARNRKMFRGNHSGRTGVNFCWTAKYPLLVYAQAHWNNEEGKACSKKFSVKKFGILPAWSMACAVREDVEKSASTPYSERHGK